MKASEPDHAAVGTAIPRLDAVSKVTGGARYASDVTLPDMAHAKVLRSPYAHARILRIDTSEAVKVPGVYAVATSEALGGLPRYGFYIKDQPVLATDIVRYIGEPVVAVAARDEATAVAALERVEIEYEPLLDIPDLVAARQSGAPSITVPDAASHVPTYGLGARGEAFPEPNVCFRFSFQSGDEDAWAECVHVFEDTFTFSRMGHLTLEPHVCVAHFHDGIVELTSSTQGPFPVRREIARLFGLPENRVRVRAPLVGGGFGAKGHCRTEPIATLLTMLCGRPVRYALTLDETFLTVTQHAAVLTLRTGVSADGRLVARESRVQLNSGAYADASPLVAEKASYRVHGPYEWRRVDSATECVMTTTPPAGPFRGFGGTQANWASESQVDMIARRLGIDPLEFRLRNLLPPGALYASGDTPIDGDLARGLKAVADAVGYGTEPLPPGYGVGLAVGVKDGGGVNKPAKASVRVSTDGDVLLLTSTVEIGSGARTTLAQIAADVLGIPVDRIVLPDIDTNATPFDQGTNASSAITVMGRAVQQACEAVKREIAEYARGCLGDSASVDIGRWVAVRDGVPHDLGALVRRHYGGVGYEFAAEGAWHAGDDPGAPLGTKCVFWETAWAAAKVHVDLDTGRLEVLQLVVSGDAGKAINPEICRGQDEGAAVMGLGQALFEEMCFEGSRLVNGEPLEYRVPMSTDIPDSFVSILQEHGLGAGPFGSKGMGEGGILPVAAAIANAVHDAVGARVTSLPLSAPRILQALDESAPRRRRPRRLSRQRSRRAVGAGPEQLG